MRRAPVVVGAEQQGDHQAEQGGEGQDEEALQEAGDVGAGEHKVRPIPHPALRGDLRSAVLGVPDEAG